MKATLTYHLPEDEQDFKWSRNGYEYWSAMRDIRAFVRSGRKHGTTLSVDEILDRIWEGIPHELMDD